MDRSRLEAFSDGVFAVAITLLALNLSVTGPGHGRLLHQLGDHWPAFVADATVTASEALKGRATDQGRREFRRAQARVLRAARRA